MVASCYIGSDYWPPRSPDLISMDFCFGGTVKNKVFARRPCTVKNMSQFILEACQEIEANKDLCSRVCMSVSSRLEEYVNADDKQFQYLRD